VKNDFILPTLKNPLVQPFLNSSLCQEQWNLTFNLYTTKASQNDKLHLTAAPEVPFFSSCLGEALGLHQQKKRKGKGEHVTMIYSVVGSNPAQFQIRNCLDVSKSTSDIVTPSGATKENGIVTIPLSPNTLILLGNTAKYEQRVVPNVLEADSIPIAENGIDIIWRISLILSS